MDRFVMPLQNRVTPYSTIEAVSVRGMFTGNRGCLHNDQKQLVTQGWHSKRWIVCALEYKNWRREVMTPRRWTELFFLDEAVAFAAGHRPCALCRRDSFRQFISLWSAQTGQLPTADALDTALHSERLPIIRGEYPRVILRDLPSGTFVRLPDPADNRAWLVYDQQLFAWSHGSYTEHRNLPSDYPVELITPPTTVAVLKAGYQPILHSTLFTLYGA
jgi:hypothetical protein